jgi:tetratricopeptide (TPR) repeat protein
MSKPAGSKAFAPLVTSVIAGLWLWIPSSGQCERIVPPPPFPHSAEALRYCAAGDDLLGAQLYETAITAYQSCVRIDATAYVPPVKLAVAYFAQGKFSEAAQQFETANRLWGGGPRGAPLFGIMEAAMMQLAGQQEEAEEFLRRWTGSAVVVAGDRAFFAGPKLDRNWRPFADYLLGDIDESRMFKKGGDVVVAHLLVGLTSLRAGDAAKASSAFASAMQAVENPSGWMYAMAVAGGWVHVQPGH